MDYGELVRKLGILTKRPGRIVDVLREPRKSVIGPRLLNQMGLQLLRVTADRAELSLRRARVDDDLVEPAATLSRDGVLVVPDFLSPSEVAEVRAEIDESRRELAHRWKRYQFGINFYTENFWISEYPSRFPASARVQQNDFCYRLACAVTRRGRSYLPKAEVQHLQKEDWEAPHVDNDYNQFAHADRHYPFIKAFIYLDDVTDDDAPYTYYPGSHRIFTGPRLRYEYRYSVRYKEIEGGAYRVEGDPLGADRRLNELAQETLAALGCPERRITGRAGTLIISNNQGFHRRGEHRGRRHRLLITMDYKFLESIAHTFSPVLNPLYRFDHEV